MGNTMPREIERRMPDSITEDHWLDLLYLMENVHAKNFTDLLRVFQQYETPKIKRRRVYGVDAKAIVDREMKENDPGSYYKERLVEESVARKNCRAPLIVCKQHPRCCTSIITVSKHSRQKESKIKGLEAELKKIRSEKRT